jgi:hypothetical protein
VWVGGGVGGDAGACFVSVTGYRTSPFHSDAGLGGRPVLYFTVCDRKSEYISRTALHRLGVNARNRQHKLNEEELRLQKALNALVEKGYTKEGLLEQWEAQKREQLSVRACE